ncbi:SSU ribosomal protein S12P methylthiotransferase [Halanaerobium saccharolyticum]|uniref:Ribosomal protein uS12 methylthiotransferase RimO n=1 Tax=Halanaerobium saccharolyticum TaxID=43595 RepID=A0A4R7ZAE7_9FIRM|nr:30S ribosomal protein S12 methylthiotransferase RimO [Halanaerobium saccharolyticum]RAK11174.1 SSU ribosomal protein S12P methylthiotransferase [Halanaerobium saccharolyticum]TDW07025.1 SSU ribosomal protein S12P methylthiotransferase [Halanaerobium saccharolyticum]TDX63790.1 SSU ribosomal protein S12P methylthiotransferase [Halanaerobium saccharolyticum]
MIRYSLMTLGCPKNEVDSQHMNGFLRGEKEFQYTDSFEKAEVIIINTCGFIQDAKEESIETILAALEYKKQYNCKSVIVTGCLTQRYSEELEADIPEIDAVLGTSNFDKIAEVIRESLEGKETGGVEEAGFDYSSSLPRELDNDVYAYLKIAEGCNNNCTYCSIPQIRGTVKSRSIADIAAEAKRIAESGIKELIIIAQDTTQYGVDIYGRSALAPLLRNLAEVEGIRWIRVLYSYPEFISDEIIEVFAEEEKVCNYFDLPIQHSSAKIRKLMNRKGNEEDIANIINKIRKKIPDAKIRTSLITGFPGENEQDFNNLKEFVKKYEFDRLGVFEFSREEGTAAYNLDQRVPEEIKSERKEEIMQLQQEISLAKNKELVGRTIEVIIEDQDQENYLARSRYDSPEIDNQIYLPIEDHNLEIGEIYQAVIKEAFHYDLIGEIEDESTK